MEINQILNVVAPAGVFGFCFVWLFMKFTNESKAREDKLMASLDKFANCFESLKSDVADIKQDVEQLKEGNH